MSKRAGEFITLDELLAEVGVDAARWFFASRAPTTGIDFDIELAKKQSAENPVYYVQYAHARIASILRKAAEEGLSPAPVSRARWPGRPEAALARAIVRFPEVVEDAAPSPRRPTGVTAYATELATQFHAFYRDARVVDAAEPERSRPPAGARVAARTPSPMPSPCSGSPRPNRCSRRRERLRDRRRHGGRRGGSPVAEIGPVGHRILCIQATLARDPAPPAESSAFRRRSPVTRHRRPNPRHSGDARP